MGERKVLNKYYPPDFDPSKLPRGKRGKNNEMKVRMMLPMSVRCKTCGNFMYKGTKFNTLKEDVVGEDYLGIQVFRFYWRCTRCAAEFTMKTDPKNADYVMEHGATRNYEPWRDADAAKAAAAAAKEEEEKGNAMKALENRTLASKREMDLMDALDEMRSLRARHAAVTTEQALAALEREAAAAAAAAGGQEEGGAGGGGGGGEGGERGLGGGLGGGGAAAAAGGGGMAGLDEEDLEAVREFAAQRRSILARRIDSDEDEGEGEGGRQQGGGRAGAAAGAGAAAAAAGPSSSPAAATAAAAAAAAAASKQAPSKPAAPAIKLVVKRKAAAAAGEAKRARAEPSEDGGGSDDGGGGGGLAGLLGGYGSSDGSQ